MFPRSVFSRLVQAVLALASFAVFAAATSYQSPLTNDRTCGYTSGIVTSPVLCNSVNGETCTYFTGPGSPNFGCCGGQTDCYVSACFGYGAPYNILNGNTTFGSITVYNSAFYCPSLYPFCTTVVLYGADIGSTGGAFQLFILVDVKDPSLDLADVETYERILRSSLPAEFQDTALLWNEALLRAWFPKVGKHNAQDQMYQALQIFSYTFPEFDNVWQIEMDARLTGNVANMLTSATQWATVQPRKNLWERNGRWFIPGLWGNYSEFAAHVDQQFSNEQGIWGPHPNADLFVDPQGPSPPEKSQVAWGIGEAPDLITFAPMIDPANTKWIYENAVHGFPGPVWELPRRMAIVSMTRTSRRLLRLISQQQRASGSWVVSESTPETWSLLHGLKAVYVPHLLAFKFRDTQDEGPGRDRSPEELDKMFHKGPPRSLAGGDQAGFLWCGANIGLPEYRWLDATYFWYPGHAPEAWWSYTNGTCTWPLLLHPVKHG